jgi:tRNA (cytidine56-2'-O)-methyltransferase
LKKPKTTVLRWGHRFRDKRVTTHVALVARAFGASGFVLADVKDTEVKTALEKTVANWGGKFHFEMATPWKQIVKEWRDKGGVVVHLTTYGENIQTSDVVERIRSLGVDVLVVVGSQKVPKEFFSSDVSDFNVAVGNQPHSEISSLAVFLDRLYEGQELAKDFNGARLRIIPQKHGKKVAKS